MKPPRRSVHLAATLHMHPRSHPIARANMQAAEEVRRWAESRPERAAPQRQDAPRMQTARFRYDGEAA